MTREQETTSEDIDEVIKKIRSTVKYLIDEVIVDLGTREQIRERRGELGSRLRALREKTGISLNSFAKKTEYDPAYVSRAERGLVSISTNYIYAASEALETSTLDLLVHGGYFIIDQEDISDRDYNMFKLAIDSRLIRYI